jgi:glycosyltransferase involved in cell wall biosynthesis
MRQSGDLLNKTIFFIPYQPTAVAFRANEVSDLAIVALKPDVYKVAFPSKTMMYLAAGCPILALIEKESELAREILERDLGLVCAQTDASQLADTIYGAWKGREIWRRKRTNISIVARQLFGKEIILKQWSGLIRELSTVSRSLEAISVS